MRGQISVYEVGAVAIAVATIIAFTLVALLGRQLFGSLVVADLAGAGTVAWGGAIRWWQATAVEARTSLL